MPVPLRLHVQPPMAYTICVPFTKIAHLLPSPHLTIYYALNRDVKVGNETWAKPVTVQLDLKLTALSLERTWLRTLSRRTLYKFHLVADSYILYIM